MIWLIVVISILLIGAISRAVRASHRRQEMASFQTYAKIVENTFPLHAGESITFTVAARDLGAVRRLASDTITDDYPSSFPLVTVTTERLVIQMSVSDRTTDLIGSFPPRRPDLAQRIGEQFLGGERGISSSEWPWICVSSVMAEADTAGVLWANECGSGAVTLTFMSIADQNRFVTTATSAMTAARSLAGIVPAEPVPTSDGGTVEYDFPNARVLCSNCGSVILAEDHFCTGCGCRIVRFQTAEQ